MKPLTIEEEKNIIGGYSIARLLSLAGVITFLIGIVDGYMRPLKCNS